MIHKQTLSLSLSMYYSSWRKSLSHHHVAYTWMYVTNVLWMKLNTLWMPERFHYSHIISFPHSEPYHDNLCTRPNTHTQIKTKKIENNKFQTSSPVTMGTQKTSHICNIRNIWWYQMNFLLFKMWLLMNVFSSELYLRRMYINIWACCVCSSQWNRKTSQMLQMKFVKCSKSNELDVILKPISHFYE